jgi:photosystem II stability/assembly factor-like uncharacterized protein
MSFRRTSIIVSLFFISQSFAQIPAKKYKWKQLGPISTTVSLTDSGRWSAVGQGWIEDFIIDKSEWYAGSITGGLYKSTNNGKKWKKIDNDTVQLGTLCLIQVDDTIFRGTGLTHYNEDFGVGLLKSFDKGKTWNETGLKFSKNDRKPLWDIVKSPHNQSMAACTPNNIYVSTSGSNDWKMVHSGKKEEFKVMLYDYAKENVLWAAGNKLLKSNDNGATWINYTDRLSIVKVDGFSKPLPRVAICQDPNDAKRYLAFYGYSNTGYVDESNDGGDTWNRICKSRNIRRADGHHTEISIAPDNSNYVILGSYRVYLSSDGGKTFKVVTTPAYKSPQFAHDDIRELSVKSTKEIYIATDGGVFVSMDTCKTWQNKSGKGLVSAQIYGLAIQEDKSVIMGCQDMGYFTYQKRKWKHLGSYYGDGGDAIETSKGTHLILGGRMRLIDINNPKSSKSSNPKDPANPFLAKFYRYPGTLDSFYYLGATCWSYNGEKWDNLSKNQDGKKELVSGFNINSSNPNQLFFAFKSPTWSSKKLKGKFYKSIDGGLTWKDYTSKLPILAWHYITGITSNPSNPKEIVVSLGKMDSDQLHKSYKSIDGGETWINYSEGIPPYETFGIKYIPSSTGIVLSTISGLFYRNSQMDAWQQLTGKIAPIVVRDFEIDIGERTIYAGTYGNGLWKMKIPRKMLRY